MISDVEAILLTGGASRRMGVDKAKVVVEGEPLAERIARILGEQGIPVTVLGREPLDGCGFLADREEFAGPLAAVGRFEPSLPLVFICSCDIPGFASELVPYLLAEIGPFDAAIPSVRGRLQPLCGLYRAEAIERARCVALDGEARVMRWVDSLQVKAVALAHESWAANVNTPEDWPGWADNKGQ